MRGPTSAAVAVRVLAARLVCRRCSRESDIALGAGSQLPRPVLDAGGYSIDGAEITFAGSCPDCCDRGAP